MMLSFGSEYDVRREKVRHTLEMLVVLLFFLGQAAPQRVLPKFEDFTAVGLFRGTPAMPILATREDRRFRTMIQEGARKGPNFAVHFTIADWGLGSNIGEFSIIDANTGRVHVPFRAVAYPPMFSYVEDPALGVAALDFRLDSRMLLIRGCPGEKRCGSYFFEWTGTRLKLLKAVPAVPLN
jgi:hypothetical protein